MEHSPILIEQQIAYITDAGQSPELQNQNQFLDTLLLFTGRLQDKKISTQSIKAKDIRIEFGSPRASVLFHAVPGKEGLHFEFQTIPQYPHEMGHVIFSSYDPSNDKNLESTLAKYQIQPRDIALPILAQLANLMPQMNVNDEVKDEFQGLYMNAIDTQMNKGKITGTDGQDIVVHRTFARLNSGNVVAVKFMQEDKMGFDLEDIRQVLFQHSADIEGLTQAGISIEVFSHGGKKDIIVYTNDRGLSIQGDKVKDIPSMETFRTVQNIVRAVDHEDASFNEKVLQGIIEPQAKAFQEEYKTHQVLTPDQEASFDAWVETPEGVATVRKLTDTVLELLDMTANNGQAGHDKRHIFKDITYALRFISEQAQDGESVTGHKLLSLVASALHDFGRLGEEKIYGKSGSGFSGEQHPKISYYFAKQILDNPAFVSMPEELKKQILYAILVHQEPNNHDSYFARSVQRADRMDLVGDWFYRIYGSDVGIHDVEMGYFTEYPAKGGEPKEVVGFHNQAIKLGIPAIPGRAGDLSVFQHVLFYARNLHENIGGPTAKAEELERRAIAVAYVLRGTTVQEQEQLFAAELAREKGHEAYAQWQQEAEALASYQQTLLSQKDTTTGETKPGFIEKPLYLPHRLNGKIVALEEEVWNLAKEFASDNKIDEKIDADIKDVSLYTLVYEACHIPGVQLTVKELSNIHTKIEQHMTKEQQERMKRSVAFGKLMQRMYDDEDYLGNSVLRRTIQENQRQETADEILLYQFAQFVERQLLSI